MRRVNKHVRAIAVVAFLSIISLMTAGTSGLLQNIRTVDLLQLIATGMLLGVLLTLVMQLILANRAQT